MLTNITAATLRGHGSYAFRTGKNIPGAVQFATQKVGRELTAGERAEVVAGFLGARTDAARDFLGGEVVA